MNGKAFLTGKGLLKRILLTLAVASGLLLLLAALNANATSIRPDIRRIVPPSQQDATAQSMPARPGAVSPASAALARAERAELIDAATPDPRAILGIAAVIFLLRLLRREKRGWNSPPAGCSAPTSDVPASSAQKEDHRIAA